MRIHNKLVRYKIPEIIKVEGKEGVTHILNEEEYIQALCIVRGYSLEELETLRAKKANERGGFKEIFFWNTLSSRRHFRGIALCDS